MTDVQKCQDLSYVFQRTWMKVLLLNHSITFCCDRNKNKKILKIDIFPIWDEYFSFIKVSYELKCYCCRHLTEHIHTGWQYVCGVMWDKEAELYPTWNTIVCCIHENIFVAILLVFYPLTISNTQRGEMHCHVLAYIEVIKHRQFDDWNKYNCSLISWKE